MLNKLAESKKLLYSCSSNMPLSSMFGSEKRRRKRGREAGNHLSRVATCSTSGSTALPRLRWSRFIFHLPRVQLWPTHFAPSLNLANYFPSLLCQARAPPNKVLVTSSLCPLHSWPWKPVPAAGFASLINPKPGSSQFQQLSSIWAVCEWWSNNALS